MPALELTLTDAQDRAALRRVFLPAEFGATSTVQPLNHMTMIKMAMRSLIGNGLKTWLNVFVLSFTFVLIIFMQGLLEGWNRQALKDTISWEIAGGQYWSQKYDPYDPFSIDSIANVLPASLRSEYNAHQIEPVLLVKGTIYRGGRMQGVLLKGIRPDQHLLALPTHLLKSKGTDIPVIMGMHIAKQANLKVNDQVTLRWRDVNGTFEAIDIRAQSAATPGRHG